MIIWLASYPKSGNTWVRIFLSYLLSNNNEVKINDTKITQFPLRRDFEDLTDNIDDLDEFVKNCINAQRKINLNNKIKIFKTHNAFWKNGNYSFTDEENTLGCIYIVRDPRNVVTSLKNHYRLENYEEATNLILDDKCVIGTLHEKREQIDLPHIISSWKNHFNSWKKINADYLLIKYENLLHSPETEFLKVINFIEKKTPQKFNKMKINEAIKNCSFENLQKKELTEGFKEAPKDKGGNFIKFFNLGPKNKWENILNSEVRMKIEKSFEKEMKELNYL